MTGILPGSWSGSPGWKMTTTSIPTPECPIRPSPPKSCADEHAARVRDYGPEDAATYESRVKEGATMMDEFDRMMHDHGLPRFDKEEGIDR